MLRNLLTNISFFCRFWLLWTLRLQNGHGDRGVYFFIYSIIEHLLMFFFVSFFIATTFWTFQKQNRLEIATQKRKVKFFYLLYWASLGVRFDILHYFILPFFDSHIPSFFFRYPFYRLLKILIVFKFEFFFIFFVQVDISAPMKSNRWWIASVRGDAAH